MLTNEDKKLIASHCKVTNFESVYMTFGTTFTCDMGERYNLIVFSNLGRINRHEQFGAIFKHNDSIIFEGFFIGVPKLPSSAIQMLDIISIILDYLSLQKGDIDPDHFDVYTLQQKAWRNKHAESLCCFGMSILEYVENSLPHDGYTPTLDTLWYSEQDYMLVNIKGLNLPAMVTKFDSDLTTALSG